MTDWQSWMSICLQNQWYLVLWVQFPLETTLFFVFLLKLFKILYMSILYRNVRNSRFVLKTKFSTDFIRSVRFTGFKRNFISFRENLDSSVIYLQPISTMVTSNLLIATCRFWALSFLDCLKIQPERHDNLVSRKGKQPPITKNNSDPFSSPWTCRPHVCEYGNAGVDVNR